MNLSASEQAFVEQRRKLIAHGPWVCGGMIAGLLGFGIWLWLSVPLMINPWAVMDAVQAGSLEETTLIIMAVMLPILMLACIGVIVVAISLSFACFANERKLIAIIQQSEKQP